MRRLPVTRGLARGGGLAWLLAVLLLLLGGAVWFAQAGTTPSAASNRPAARQAAIRLLADVWLPAGATQVNGDLSASGWLGGSVASAPATPNLLDFHRFWQLAGDPQTVIEWIEAHRPRGAKILTIGTAGQYGKTVMWLRGSATLPTRFPAPPALVAQLNFRNVSGTACSLNGFARLRLLGATGQPLPTRVTNSNFPASVVTLTPGMSAGIGLQWPPPSQSCTGARAASVKVTLPHVSPPFLVPVGSRRQPFAPCRGQIQADAIGITVG